MDKMLVPMASAIERFHSIVKGCIDPTPLVQDAMSQTHVCCVTSVSGL